MNTLRNLTLPFVLCLCGLAQAQSGVLDQASPFPPIPPPGIGGGLGAFLTTQVFDQEVRIGVHGTFEGFRFSSQGDLGASVTVRIRPGPASAPGAAVFQTTVTRSVPGIEMHFVDASAAGLQVVPGGAVTLELVGTGSIFYFHTNHMEPVNGPPLYPFPLYVNGAPFSDGGYRMSFDTFTLTSPGSRVYYCSGNGSGTQCPCGNNAQPFLSGCLHSLGVGGILRVAGTASIAADTLVLDGNAMPNSTALYFQGTRTSYSGLGTQFADGLLCVAGSIVRLSTKVNSGGASHYPSAGDPSVSVRGACAPGDVRNYQVWFRNSAAFCTPATANLTNAAQVVWAS